MDRTIQPVLLGADLNCYSVARAFHEAYGIKSRVFGRYPLQEIQHTRILDFTAVPDLDTDTGLMRTLNTYAGESPHKTKVLVGCTDDYAALLIRKREALQDSYIVPYPSVELFDNLETKESFYSYCEHYGLSYPKTVIIKPDDSLSILDSLPFQWPVIVKPSSSIEYWKHPFDGMRKVYETADREAAALIIQSIFGSGYQDSIVIQDLIPGADCEMRVLTVYCNQNAKVEMACLGRVLLELHTPKGRGNHAAILTEHNGVLMEKLCRFLESIGYTGFANFDIKYDTRDGEFKILEINLRQGRSNYYVTGAGHNIARYLVDDWVLGKEHEDTLFHREESFWSSIPFRIVNDYTDDINLVRRAKDSIKHGRVSTSLNYPYDLHLNPRRWLYVKKHYLGYFRKYRDTLKKRSD